MNLNQNNNSNQFSTTNDSHPESVSGSEHKSPDQVRSDAQSVLLLVDDKAEVHLSFNMFFRSRNDYKIIAAYNGEEAIELAKKHRDEIGLLVLDVMLPDIVGDELYEMLLEIGIASNTPVIFQTGMARPTEKIARLLNNGRAVILHKPYTKAALFGAIQKVCQQRASETLTNRGDL